MAAVAERAINGELACPRGKEFHDLLKHDRPVRAGLRLAPGDHLGDVVCITLRRVFLILFRKAPRILSSVTRPTPGFLRAHVPICFFSRTKLRQTMGKSQREEPHMIIRGSTEP